MQAGLPFKQVHRVVKTRQMDHWETHQLDGSVFEKLEPHVYYNRQTRSLQPVCRWIVSIL